MSVFTPLIRDTVFYILSPAGVVQGMITGIRGLCNGLGPALYGFVFYLFHVELSDTDPSEKGAKSNMANPTDEVNMTRYLDMQSHWIMVKTLVLHFHSSRLLRVPSSRAPPSCLARALCCCPCWWPCLSQSTRGLAWDPVPIRSTAMGLRVTPIVHKAVGLRARSPCWRTAAYNLSWRGQKLLTWHHATLRTQRDARILIHRCSLTSVARQTEVLWWGICVFSTRVVTPSLAAFYFWNWAPDAEEPGSGGAQLS